jgi:adenosylcobinamide-GDP ribazoletransferase
MRSMLLAFSFLSRFWVPRMDVRPETFGAALAWFPLVGILLGSVGAGVLVLGSPWVGAGVAAALAVTCLAWLSGGLHLDGLADTIDGFSAGRGNRERTLEVMSDSRIGAHGAVGLIILLQLKWALLVRLTELELGVAHVCAALVSTLAVSRCCAAVLIVVCPAAKPQGLGTLFRVPRAGRYAALSVFWCLAVGACAYGLLLPGSQVNALWGLGLGLTVAVTSAAATVRRLGGLTGDTLGAIVEVSEVVGLLGWGLA